MMAYICTPFFFRDQFQDGRLVAILLLKCVPNHFSDMHGPILFNLGTSTVHDGIQVPSLYFVILFKMATGRLVAILVVHKYWLELSVHTAKLQKQQGL